MAKNTKSAIVYCKLPNGVCFDLKGGHRVTLKGKPLSSLVDSNGNPAHGTAYGTTTIPTEQWEEIQASYGHMDMFGGDAPVIFAAVTPKAGEAQASEQAEAKTGFEQVQVDGDNVDKSLKTQPEKA
ncbi:MAG: hypothetical protein PHI96_00725 [Desulfovibrio sp.]|nr:hypothetical protein [Desulfovibrio sp.]